MAEPVAPGAAYYAAVILGIVVLWEMLKRVWTSLFATPIARVGVTLDADVARQFADLHVPPEPHLEFALDPPCGLHHSNPKEPYHFETESTRGSYILFHPPTGQATASGPDGFDYAEYFQCKSRLWEMRVRLNFKKPPPPEAEMFFGIELEEYVNLSRATVQAQRVIVAGISQVVGGLYQSPGDDPCKATGERERPCCVLPLWAFDQFIETPQGASPPSLTDPDFSEMGKKRYKRISQYAQEIRSLQASFKVGPTYTFAFWGNSRFLDAINWVVIGIPLVTPLDFDRFAGKPPVHMVLYSLAPNSAGRAGEHRHIQARKSYYFRAAVWSSSRRPEREKIEALTGARLGATGAGDDTPKQGKSLRRRFEGFVRKLDSTVGLTACTQRKQED